MAKRLPLVAFGNVAVGVFAFGNVAYGVVAVGLSVSVGVIAVGTNAVGGIALGLNSLGPIAIGAINAIGTVVLAGVNAIGGIGGAFGNTLTHPIVGGALAAIAFGINIARYKPRPPRSVPEPLSSLLEENVKGLETEALVEQAGDRLALVDGDTRLEVTGEVDTRDLGKRCTCRVRVEIDLEGGDYREAPERKRRYVLEQVTRIDRTPQLATRDDLDRVFAGSLPAAAVFATVAMLLSRWIR